MSKNRALLVSILAGIVAFVPIDYLTGWDRWFPFVHPFNVVAVALWGTVLYLTLRKAWTKKKCLSLAVLLLLSALPQALFCVLVYSAWICTGGSLVLAVLLLIKLRSSECKK